MNARRAAGSLCWFRSVQSGSAALQGLAKLVLHCSARCSCHAREDHRCFALSIVALANGCQLFLSHPFTPYCHSQPGICTATLMAPSCTGKFCAVQARVTVVLTEQIFSISSVVSRLSEELNAAAYQAHITDHIEACVCSNSYSSSLQTARCWLFRFGTKPYWASVFAISSTALGNHNCDLHLLIEFSLS